jgi:hypothetical protein
MTRQDDISLRRRILCDAADDSPLWELPWRASEIRGGETIQTRGEMSIEALIPCSSAMVRSGLVLVVPLDRRPEDAKELAPLEVEQAIAVLEDPRNWIPQAESKQPIAYTLRLSARGKRKLQRRPN